MAIKDNCPPRIHHSDRGSQYTYTAYIELLKTKGCKISMGLCGQDNAYAERINGTIKGEYLNYWKPTTLGQLKKRVKNAVDQYNNVRPHNHLGSLSPVAFERMWATLKPKDRPYFTIFDNET